ncbi:MAG: cobalamin biosynthesis protein [Candidatus Manganitrophaceae bacterium]
MKKDLAVVAITKGGVEIARRLRDHFSQADFLISEKFAGAVGEGVIPLKGSLSKNVGDFFHAYDKIVFLVSLGAVIRLIAPHLKDKHVDPAILVVDDRAEFVISVLSGHVGGANAFTETVATALGATPVITTASDVGKTIPVDILGRELGWTLEGDENVTRVSACVVNEEPIAFLQETGEKHWWNRPTPLPSNIDCFTSLPALTEREQAGRGYSAYLVVTDRSRNVFPESMQERIVLYRPKSLDLGMGCDRGTPLEEIEALIRTTFAQHQLEWKAIRTLATLDLKSDEPAFLQLCEKNGWRLVTFSKEELQQVEGILTPSAVVEKWVGTPSVSEAAALRSSGASGLLIPKVKAKRATLAVARVVF